MTLTATRDSPVSIYYCKAGIKTGLTIRVLHKGSVHTCAGISLSSTLADGPFDAVMSHDNAKGKPKASGGRCVLIVSAGRVQLTFTPPHPAFNATSNHHGTA